MRTTVIQMNSQTDKDSNLAEARRLCSEAVEAERPDLVVFPEMLAFLGGSVVDRQASAERIPGGKTTETLRSLAMKHGVTVHGGSFYETADDSDLIYNTTVVFDPSGKMVAKYRKIHLFDITAPDGTEYKESEVVGRGSGIETFDICGVRVGCSICYDIRFGELYRKLAERGADVIVVPAAFTLQTGKGSLGNAIASASDRNSDLYRRRRSMRILSYAGRHAKQLGPFHDSRSLGPCRRAGQRRDGICFVDS